MARSHRFTIFAITFFQITFGSSDFATKIHHEPVQTYSMDNRIIGGRPAKAGELPFQLQMRYLDLGHLCGATLVISPRSKKQIGITAAHCVTFPNTTDPIPKERFTIRAGALGVNATGQTLTLNNVRVHPGYTPLSSRGSPNDIAMLSFNGQFTLNQNVQPLALPMPGQQTTGIVTVSGWGVTNSSNLKEASPVLRLVQLPVVNSATCNNWYREETGTDMIYPTNICAGLAQGGKSSCSGDSGGPLIGTQNRRRYLAGVVSWGNKVCDAPQNPGVFTRVSSYISWIRRASFRCETPSKLT